MDSEFNARTCKHKRKSNLIADFITHFVQTALRSDRMGHSESKQEEEVSDRVFDTSFMYYDEHGNLRHGKNSMQKVDLVVTFEQVGLHVNAIVK